MSEKIAKVSQWLAKIFGDQTPPEYEVNTRTVDILYHLAENSEVRCKEVSLLIEDQKQKAEEYQSDGNHRQEVILQGVGLSSGSLRKPASDYMTALEAIAVVLKVKDTSLASFVPAINNQTNELLEAEKRDRQMERELTVLRKKLGSTLVLRRTLQEDIKKVLANQEVEKAQAEERLLNMDFVKAKSKDLLYRTKMAESPSLAIVKIEEAKRELAAIDAELEMKVDIMNMAIPKQHGRSLK
ncbi:hypothetical protein JZ751_011794 [Albula glossodonta]|uniref:HAUS augmin-like complex subunit 1 n=1 Tax=Albula glossodonta TaxID=121402 RepID=A0A8T2PQL6_9TELE|nr:hypothetical protein JZ751_011794 [Albula glossodonta]